MSSPIKNKAKLKEPLESKKKQLLNVFHQTIPFLQLLTPEELEFLEDQLHIIVFTRSQILAKEAEIIDYVGVIAEGRAVSKKKVYQIGDAIGHPQLLGYQQRHTESISGESDGILIAIRIHELMHLPRISLVNKIVNHFAQVYTNELLQR
jgi:signal-transduction protein with cAMP-binding, CBS, and nucleotidyltransferase domain